MTSFPQRRVLTVTAFWKAEQAKRVEGVLTDQRVSNTRKHEMNCATLKENVYKKVIERFILKQHGNAHCDLASTSKKCEPNELMRKKRERFSTLKAKE